MSIRESDKWKTGFCTIYDYFEYQVMLFGLSNAPNSFQEYINKILAKKLDSFVILYLNDILVYTKDPGQPHVDTSRWVLKQLWKYGLFANLKKCYFYQDEMHFLGFVIFAQGNIRSRYQHGGRKN